MIHFLFNNMLAKYVFVNKTYSEAKASYLLPLPFLFPFKIWRLEEINQRKLEMHMTSIGSPRHFANEAELYSMQDLFSSQANSLI